MQKKHITSASLRRPAVLVVDDEDDLRSLLSNILKRKGFPVFDAENGRDGLAVFEAHQEEIGYILADINMPELSGKELSIEIRKRDPIVKVILISGDYTTAEIDDFLAKHSLKFIAKPFIIDELLKAMDLR